MHLYGYGSEYKAAGAGFGFWQAGKARNNGNTTFVKKRCTGRGTFRVTLDSVADPRLFLQAVAHPELIIPGAGDPCWLVILDAE